MQRNEVCQEKSRGGRRRNMMTFSKSSFLLSWILNGCHCGNQRPQKPQILKKDMYDFFNIRHVRRLEFQN